MKLKVFKGAEGKVNLNLDKDSFLGKMIAGTQGEVRIKSSLFKYEPVKKTKKKSE